MNPQQSLKETLAMLRESSVLSALAYDAIHGYKSDDLSSNEAYKTYGEGWIKDRLKRGFLHTIRSGEGKTSPVYFSRYEIECVKRSEKLVEEIYNKLSKADSVC